MPPVSRDSEELRTILEHHTVQGYHVMAPIIGSSIIQRQEGTGPVRRYTDSGVELGSPQAAYVVKPDHEVTFDEWIKGKGLSKTPWSFDAWAKKYGGPRNRQGVLPMLMELREELESGRREVSEAEAEHGLMKNAGCIGPDDTVTCATFWASQVYIDPKQLEEGMMVEFEFQRRNQPVETIPGRIVGFIQKDGIALLEVLTPLPYVDSPDAIVSAAIRPGFYSSRTYSIGYGTRQGMEDHGFVLPPGKLREDERQYVLEDLLDLSVIEEFCTKNYPKDKHCFWQSLLLYILPITLSGKYAGKWRPLPENVVTAEFVVDYEHE